jgi:hypothetical protein
MVSSVTVWTSRVISVIALSASVYTFWRVAGGELNEAGSFPAYFCACTFFALATIFAALVLAAASAQLPENYVSFETVLRIVNLLIPAVIWMLVPVYLSVNEFYLKKRGLSIANYFVSEMDIIVISAMWNCLLLGVNNRYERAVVGSLLPVTVIGICLWNMNIFGAVAMACLVYRGISPLFYSQGVENDPLSHKDYFFQDIRIVLTTIIFMSATIWKLLAGKSKGFFFFDDSFWENLGGYFGK